MNLEINIPSTMVYKDINSIIIIAGTVNLISDDKVNFFDIV